MIRKTTECSKTFTILHEVAGWAVYSFAFTISKNEILRAASSCANSVLHGETLSAVFIADTRNELISFRTACSDALSVNEFVELVALGSDAGGALLHGACRAVFDGADAVDLLEALRTAKSEALAVFSDGAGRTVLHEVSDALVAFFGEALWALLQHAGALFQLEALRARDALARQGLAVEGEELFVAAANLVALAVDEFVAISAADTDTRVFTGLGVEAQLTVLAAVNAEAAAVHQALAGGAVRLARSVSQRLAFWAGESDALADDRVEALVDWTCDGSAFV